MGKENYYINTALVNLFMTKGEYGPATDETIITDREINEPFLQER